MASTGEKMVKLHIGCGKRDFGPEWIHIDGSGAEPAGGAAAQEQNGDQRIKDGSFAHIKYHDIVNLPDFFAADSVDLIYCSHTLEYFDRDEVKGVLGKWLKVLKPVTGVLRLAVPDFGACAKLYAEKGVPLSYFVGMMYGKWQITNDLCAYHKTIYDQESLTQVLQAAGFDHVEPWDWRTTDHAHHDDYSQAYYPHMQKETGTLISLNLEARKSSS